jgi:hypothetical protein
MEHQTNTQNTQPITIELEFLPENEHDPNPAAVSEAEYTIVSTLKQNGYTVQPIYTGKRGDFLFAIPLVLPLIGQAIAANKDLLIELLKTIEPIIEYIFKDRDKKAPADKTQPPVKVDITIDGASISVEAPDVESAERLVKLANKFRSTHPTIAQNITPQSKVKITNRVPKPQQRHRR